ncbi:TetR/AcrR family transcriptional regulator [Filimonas effusa]|uniref:TetR/AcrR family transcriptional regulator n=1 Tax=Filimonas effusa TaxID=2508721 RepID=A0A4Q1DBP8_9BACT|nr:TetR/AcrR family transcriptional regulator [Filimonas effusa]RXK85939.1 TetR/AcrR family transcriptional regulator [Filimonas effusa]
MKPRDENKVNEIYAATLQLVKENGLSGITMSMIARKAGFATGTVYIYFENKEQLIVQLFEKCFRNYAQDYFAGFDPSAPFKVAFHTIWMNMVKHSTAKFNELIFIEQCFHSPFISEETRKTSKEMLKPWLDLIEKGKNEKLIKQLETPWLMIYIRGPVREMIKYAEYNKVKISKELIDNMFEMCWNGIRA